MMIKRYSWLLALLMLLAIPSAAFAQEDLPHPAFYVYMTTGSRTELVKISPTAAPEAVAEIDPPYQELPLTIEEAMPDVEVEAFREDLKAGRLQEPEALLEPGIRKELWGFWAVKIDEFLLHRNYVRCNNSMVDPCYGYTEFSVLNTTTDTERVIWTLPYHEQREEFDGLPCYQAVFYENYSSLSVVADVQLNPTRDLVAVTINSYRSGCKSYILLLDYGSDAPQPQVLEGLTALSWSPSGNEMAYVEEISCDSSRACIYDFTRMSLDTGMTQPFQQLLLSYPGMLVWLDAETVVYSRPLMPEEAFRQEAVVWHNIRTNFEVVRPMGNDSIPDHVFRVSDGQASIIYATTWLDAETQGVATILTDDPSDLQLGNYQVESANSRNAHYAVVTLCIDVKIMCERGETGFIDVYGGVSMMNLESYRQQYGADKIEFAAIAVDE